MPNTCIIRTADQPIVCSSYGVGSSVLTSTRDAVSVGNLSVSQAQLVVPNLTCTSINGVSQALTTITGYVVTNSGYTPLTQTSLDADVNVYYKVQGTNLRPGSVVMVGNTAAYSTTYVNDTELRVYGPNKAAGTYTLTVVGGDSTVATFVGGIGYSDKVVWGISSGSFFVDRNVSFSYQLSASSDSVVTYATTDTIPETSLSSTGILSGNITSVESSTTYFLFVTATDEEGQSASKFYQLIYTAIPTSVSQVKALYGTTSGVYQISLGGVVKSVFFDLDGTYTNGDTSGWMLYQSFGTSPAASFQNTVYGGSLTRETSETVGNWTFYEWTGGEIGNYANYIRSWYGNEGVGYMQHDVTIPMTKVAVKFGLDAESYAGGSARLHINNTVVNTVTTLGSFPVHIGTINTSGATPHLIVDETGTSIYRMYYIFVQ